MKPVPRLLLLALTAVGTFSLARWTTETLHMDCSRPQAARSEFRCMVELTRRGTTRLFALDETTLRSARTIHETQIDHDGSVEHRWHLELVQRDGSIRSDSANRDAIEARVSEINRFLSSPEQTSLRFTHDNRWQQFAVALLLVMFVAGATHDFGGRSRASGDTQT